MSEDIIEHSGVVKGSTEQFISVELLSKTQCKSCSAKSVCSLGTDESKIIEVPNSGFKTFNIGETVNVKMLRSMGIKALWIAYLIPLLILIFVMIIMSLFISNELIIGLSIISTVGLYYLFIWFFRNKLKNEFIFEVEKLN